jgi:prevent-host-death family protein
MSEEIGVRELKTHASEIVRSVRETRARYTVTYRGKPVGILMPLPEGNEADETDHWAELKRLGEEIGRGWKSPLTSLEILNEIRR